MENVLGVNIRARREDRSFTLRRLADMVGASPSLISQVENGKISPSLLTLKNIADALGTTVGALVGETTTVDGGVVIRCADRQVLSNIGSGGMTMEMLTRQDAYKQMEPLWFTLEPGAASGEAKYTHFGQEFVLVIKGAMEISLNDDAHSLHEGDSIYFNASIPHFFKNIHDGRTEAIWVITPPSF